MSSPQSSYNTPVYYPHYPYQSPSGYHPHYHQPPPPHLNGHAPIHTPPRMNGPGPSSGPGRGYPPNRAGPPDFQNYHTLSPQQFAHGPNTATPSPPPVSPQFPHLHKPHPTHVPYSHYVASQNVPYPMVWPSEPLSPLPKQLSMLTPLPHSHTAPNLHPPPPSEHLEPPSEPPPELAVDDSSPSSPLSERASSTSYDEQHAHPKVSSAPETEVSASPSVETVYVIWSRRPEDPSIAPAIIISPRARPPENVVHQAISLPTPPLTPVRSISEVLPNAALEKASSSGSEKESSVASPHNVEIPSSSGTETTTSTAPDTPLAGSPASSNTSISVIASPGPGTSNLPSPSKIEPSIITQQDQPTTKEESPSSSSTPGVVPPLKKSWASLLRPDGLSASSTKTPNALPVSSVVGFSIPGGVETSSSGPLLTDKKQDLLALLTSGPVGPGAATGIRPRGLVNSGNMCFANAVLQVLIYCQPFYRLFTELARYLPSPGAGSPLKKSERKTLLIDATIQFLAEFMPPSDGGKSGKEDNEDDVLESFTPVCIYDAMKEKKRFDNMRGGHQEDAEEFLGFYLDTLEDELLYILDSITPPARPAKPASSIEEREEEGPRSDGWLEVGRRNRTVITRTQKITESPITRIFGGSFRSTLRVPSQKDSAVIETWRSLQLDIQREQVHTISDALQFISHPQSVQVTSQTRPGVTVEASQQVMIETLPPVLVLHLKRFLYDTQVGGVVKIGKPISFTPDLDIDPELISPGRRSQRVKYKLFGVLYHHGLSASGGHYTLDVLHPHRDLYGKPREAWMRIDDELVSDVLPKDVFHDVDADHRCPYLLFYRRVGSVWSGSRN